MKFQNNRHSLSITIFTLLILFSCGRGGGEIEPNTLISVDLSSKLTISTSVDGPGGTISDSQDNVNSGQSVKIIATADKHYQLKEWRGDCDSFSKDNLEITFTASKSCNVTAEFEKISYLVTATSKGGGSLSDGELSREEGQTAAFTAEPQEGYQFSEWKVGEDSDCPTIEDTSNPKVTFVVVGNCSLEAVFVKAPRTITTIADEGGFLTSNGEIIETLTVDHGDEVEIIATNEDHYELKNWESSCGDFGDGQLTIKFTAEKDCTIKAVFEEVNYTIAVSSTDGGSVSDEGELSIVYGQTAILTVKHEEGYEFSGWKTSDCTTLEDTSSPKAEFIVGGNCSLVAEFSKALRRITTISNEGGEITDTETAEYGDEVVITATAKEHYQLKRWQGTCGDFNAESLTVTIPVEKDCTIEAFFEKVNYNIQLSSTDGGSVSEEGELSIEHGQPVSFIATPEDGYEFSGWTLAEDAGCPSQTDVSNINLEFTVSGDCKLQAVFEKKIHTIRVTSSDGGSVSDTELVETYDQSVTLTATSEDGYEFSGWTLLEETGCPKLDDDSNPTLEFIVKGDCQLQADFTPIPRTITTSADEGGKITDTQIVNHGNEVTIEVTVDEHYEFSGWEGTCGEFSSEKRSINFTISKDCGIRAKIKKVLYTITIEAGAGGDVDPVKKEIGFGESFEITAWPEEDYVLDNWRLSGSGCPEIFDITYDYPILKVEGDCDLEASFKYKFDTDETTQVDDQETTEPTTTQPTTTQPTATQPTPKQIAPDCIPLYVDAERETIRANDCVKDFIGKKYRIDPSDDTSQEYLIIREENLRRLVRIEEYDLEFVCTTFVEDMSYLFGHTVVSFNEDISKWDVSNVTNMRGMFSGAKAFNQDISKWDVGNVTNMSLMFNGAIVFNQNIYNWDVSNVTSMRSMFKDAEAFNMSINNWEVRKVKDMSRMFSGATIFDQSLNGWDIRNVTDMSDMFHNATDFDQFLNGWYVEKVFNMTRMFYGATSFNQNLSNWDVRNVGLMESMFEGATSFNRNLSSWNNRVDRVYSMQRMFYGATSFSQDLSGWDAGRVRRCAEFADGGTPSGLIKPTFTNCLE